MIASKFRTPRSLALAAILIVAALYVGWVAVRTTALNLLANGNAPVSAIIAGEPEVVLGTAMGRFAADRARVRPGLLPPVLRAATDAPLDERPYLLVGSDRLQARRDAAAIEALEAGRRLNPRQRWIHVLLLDRYLRRGDYAQAAVAFGVLSRLVYAAQSPIADALAQMSVAPETRDAVRQTLRQDPALERTVLAALSSGNVEPSVIFAMASPSALAAANAPGGWGTVLVDRLVAKQRYRAARTIWQRINGLSDAQVAPLLFNADFATSAPKPPFNWTLASGDVAAVDLRGDRLEVNYYGRATGDLASQLVLLPPGSYRFVSAYSGLQRSPGPALVWSINCANQADRVLGRIELPESGPAQRRAGFAFTVLSGCPAQQLRLVGQAGEFPSPVSATILGLRIEKVGRQ